MAYEISQFDLASRQLLTGGARPAPKTCTEIGNATVTQSIFGKAKVRIICAHDRIRRVRTLSAILAITIAGAVWQLTEHGEKLFGSASEPVIATVQVSPPAFMPEYVAPSASPQKQGNLRTPTEAEIYQLTTRRLPPPPVAVQQPNLSLANPLAATPANGQATGQAPAKAPLPAAAQPTAPRTTLAAPQTTPQPAQQATRPAATQPPLPAAPKPVAVTPTPAATLAVHPTTEKLVTPATAPLTKTTTPAKPPEAQIQPSPPASTQP
ncbi:MAG TPA: hypothetical protein VGD24_05900 [Gallionella sp.]